MEAITATTPQADTSQAASTQSASNTALGKEDFLTLLVAQLQQQDPLDPADPTEFTAQLAQFSSLEQLFGVNDNLQEMAGANAQMEKFSTLSLIGKMIAVEGNSFAREENASAIPLGYSLPGNASAVTLQVQDASGGVVALLQGDATNAGQHFVTWDGRGLNGEPLPAGDYRLVVNALDAQGEAMTASPLVSLKVNGVDLTQPVPTLNTDNGDYTMNQVLGVRARETLQEQPLEEEASSASGGDAGTANSTEEATTDNQETSAEAV